jgi:hypothetical protein
VRRSIGGLIAATLGLAGLLLAAAAVAAPSTLPKRAVVPHIASGDLVPTPTRTPTPRPTPRPQVYVGPVSSLYLASAGMYGASPVREGDTHYKGSREYFDDPAHPSHIIWYPRFSRPGFAGNNTIFAAHVNYVGYGNGPFAGLLSAARDDALYITMGNGSVLTYTVRSVTLYRLSELDMDAVTWPAMDAGVERVTLISCGGTFIPAASGYGGEYDSRIVLVAERYVP